MSFQRIVSNPYEHGQSQTMSFLYQLRRTVPETINFLSETRESSEKSFPLLNALIDDEIFVYHD